MATYVVTWEIDTGDHESPIEAAEWARMIQRDPASIAGVFRVADIDTGAKYEVDLDEDPPTVKEAGS